MKINNEEYPIKVNYNYTNDINTCKEWLNSLPNLFAADFETANKLSKDQIESYKALINKVSIEEKLKLDQKIKATGLSHPYLTTITHFSVAWSDKDAYVFICDNNSIKKIIFNFLVTTDKTQIWHNCGFDFKHILFNTGKIPIKFIDTQLLAKSLINDANSFKSNTKLKNLMAYAYGDWAVSKDTFVIEEMYKDYVIKYSAIDSCATYKLYQDIMSDLNKWSI